MMEWASCFVVTGYDAGFIVFRTSLWSLLRYLGRIQLPWFQDIEKVTYPMAYGMPSSCSNRFAILKTEDAFIKNYFYLIIILVLNAWAAWLESDLSQSVIPCLSAGLAINPYCLVSRSTLQKKCSWWGKAISRLILPWFIVMKHIYAGEINIPVLPPLRV